MPILAPDDADSEAASRQAIPTISTMKTSTVTATATSTATVTATIMATTTAISKKMATIAPRPTPTPTPKTRTAAAMARTLATGTTATIAAMAGTQAGARTRTRTRTSSASTSGPTQPSHVRISSRSVVTHCSPHASSSFLIIVSVKCLLICVTSSGNVEAIDFNSIALGRQRLATRRRNKLASSEFSASSPNEPLRHTANFKHETRLTPVMK